MEPLIYKISFNNYYFPLNDIYGDTRSSEYYPLHAAKSRYVDLDNSKLSEHVVHNIFRYSKLGSNPSSWTSVNYEVFKNTFKGNGTPMNYRIKKNDVDYKFSCCAGCIIESSSDKILMQLCIHNSEISYTMNEGEYRAKLDLGTILTDVNEILKPEKLRLYISVDFFKEEYKNLYKRVHKDIVELCYSLGVEVVITTSEKIESTVYATVVERTDFDKLEDLERYIGDMNLSDAFIDLSSYDMYLRTLIFDGDLQSEESWDIIDRNYLFSEINSETPDSPF